MKVAKKRNIRLILDFIAYLTDGNAFYFEDTKIEFAH
jgi:hypothetical protein